MRENEKLTKLGSAKTTYSMDYDPSVLESFNNKHPQNDYFVKFNCPEFDEIVILHMTIVKGFEDFWLIVKDVVGFFVA